MAEARDSSGTQKKGNIGRWKAPTKQRSLARDCDHWCVCVCVCMCESDL
jgi:hypothetical protein